MLRGRDIMVEAGQLLQDEEHVRWPLAELGGWINAAVDAILLAKPSASSTSIVMPLQPGTLQQVPQSAAPGAPTPLRLLGINRNIITAGPPRAGGRVIRPTKRSLLDAQEPNWHDRRHVPYRSEVRQIVFDEENPLEFYVYPGNDGRGLVEAIVATRPARLAPTGDPTLLDSWLGDVGLSEIYSEPIVDYACYRAQQKDDYAANMGRAAVHYQNFATAIGLKIQVEGATSPNRDRKK
ncbi:hypothetical protein BN1110_06296 [bacterium YEK0313]|nr:hypothetical protein BN1110_06296 [bacterium YEK0313]